MSAEEEMYDELLGAYALDAVDDDERMAIEEYLAVNPRAAGEVAGFRELATMLAWSSATPPDGLWDRIASSLDEAPPAPGSELAKVMPLGGKRRRRRTGMVAAWVAAAAAAAVLTVVVVDAVKHDGRPASALQAAYDDARHQRDSRKATLVSGDGALHVDAVVESNGHGFLQATDLPALGADRTYQLWGVLDGQAISLGVLGPRPGIEPFSATGPLTQLVITIEKAGGVISNGNPNGALSATLS